MPSSLYPNKLTVSYTICATIIPSVSWSATAGKTIRVAAAGSIVLTRIWPAGIYRGFNKKELRMIAFNSGFKIFRPGWSLSELLIAHTKETQNGVYHTICSTVITSESWGTTADKSFRVTAAGSTILTRIGRTWIYCGIYAAVLVAIYL